MKYFDFQLNKSKRAIFKTERHPFAHFVPDTATCLIVGTFPTAKVNRQFEFFYGGRNNSLWIILSNLFRTSFHFSTGATAVHERKTFLSEHCIGMADMHEVCYRKGKSSADEDLHSIILTDVFGLLANHPTVKKLVLTSRTDVFGALGLLQTYFLQKGREFRRPERISNNVLQGSFQLFDRNIEVLVPYSPSPRVISGGKATTGEILNMYEYCLEREVQHAAKRRG